FGANGCPRVGSPPPRRLAPGGRVLKRPLPPVVSVVPARPSPASVAILVAALSASGCSTEDDAPPARDAGMSVDAPVLRDAAGLGSFCDLPGSVVWSDGAPAIVAGGAKLPDLTWMHLPDGFCAHYYANVAETR